MVNTRAYVPIGKKFGSRTVLGYYDTHKRKSRWKVRCDCGRESVVFAQSLLDGAGRCRECYKREARKT